MEKKILDIPAADNGIRLNKYLSDAGFCSRREADRLIEEGKVKIDGNAAVVGQRVLLGQTVSVGNKKIYLQNSRELIAYNKPVGIECTSNLSVRNNIISAINYKTRIYPIGRLDKASRGLILLTNDGSIVNKILRGRNMHEKEYEVIVDKPVTGDFLENMRKGVPILDTVTRPCKIKKIGKCKFDIILTQGLNRQIRRMCEELGFKVVDLKRIRVINIELGNLKEGQCRKVTQEEYMQLIDILGRDGD